MKESMEMYLETILMLQKEHGHAHSTDIAKSLKVSKPSVTKAMNSLKSKGLIHKESYGPISLTKEGFKYSESIFLKHELINKFLVKSLNLSEKEALDNACRMEHVISDEMLEAIKEYIKE